MEGRVKCYKISKISMWSLACRSQGNMAGWKVGVEESKFV